ncbi:MULTISPECIES: hypothetical protein [Rhizobium]|jgi:hypothetical protein|nr:hypothetical protein [Rhizobium leguminosarum]MBA8830669.1 hypothetical protein [Rhizobium leguminosarum]MDH6274781.1 hypothetical protein [Rhizobium leguminosarum]MVO91587.1 hypothetical protein [Rhizobium leguminosarum bv. phaseoli]
MAIDAAFRRSKTPRSGIDVAAFDLPEDGRSKAEADLPRTRSRFGKNLKGKDQDRRSL